MRESRFTEEQIIVRLKEHQAVFRPPICAASTAPVTPLFTMAFGIRRDVSLGRAAAEES